MILKIIDKISILAIVIGMGMIVVGTYRWTTLPRHPETFREETAVLRQRLDDTQADLEEANERIMDAKKWSTGTPTDMEDALNELEPVNP